MRSTTCKAALLAGALALTMHAAAQQKPWQRVHVESTDVAATFSLEHAQVALPGGNSFWLKGGSADGSATLWKGLGVAANFTGETASNIQNGVGLSKIAYMFGPRYIFNTSHYTDRYTKQHGTQVFGEALFGGVHAFNSIFPEAGIVSMTANGFSMQLGGGLDVAIAKGFSVRALELDYVHTNLPNNASNSQNDFRIAFGVSYRFGR